jgi:hypothetical protein
MENNRSARSFVKEGIQDTLHSKSACHAPRQQQFQDVGYIKYVSKAEINVELESILNSLRFLKNYPFNFR